MELSIPATYLYTYIVFRFQVKFNRIIRLLQCHSHSVYIGFDQMYGIFMLKLC